MELGPHAAFVVAAYAAAITVICSLVTWIVADHRALQRKLTELEKQGVKRRSEQ